MGRAETPKAERPLDALNFFLADVATELFKSMTGVEMTHVPNKGLVTPVEYLKLM